MKIAIIGAGNVGGALAQGWAKAGHSVILGVRDVTNKEITTLVASSKNLRATSVSEAAREAEIILVALPIPAVVEVAKNLGEVKDKIIIDATNAAFQKPTPFTTAFEAFKTLTRCEHVVKCFNSTGFENMENPQYGAIGIDMFVASSSAKGKQAASQLAKDLGFAECYDFGGDDKVQLLEHFAMAWINLAIIQKQGRNMAFKLIRR